MSVLQQDDLVGLTGSIWEAVLGREVLPVLDEPAVPLAGPVTAFVAITGGWDGSVAIALSGVGARRAAAAMFAMDEDELDDGLVDDAVGELANIAAGNIKGMLVEACTLGLPTVVRGSDYHVSVPGTSVVLEAVFECEGERFTVAVQSPNDLPAVA